MQATSRPRRVDVVVLGRGPLAASTALLLAERGKTVALLVERSSDPAETVSPAAESVCERLSAFEKCYCVVGTWVRGISVIENAVLGVIAEDARYDSRTVLNLAQDERHAAYARMMRQPAVTGSGAPRVAPATVTGGWQLQGEPEPGDVQSLALAVADLLAPATT